MGGETRGQTRTLCPLCHHSVQEVQARQGLSAILFVFSLQGSGSDDSSSDSASDSNDSSDSSDSGDNNENNDSGESSSSESDTD